MSLPRSVSQLLVRYRAIFGRLFAIFLLIGQGSAARGGELVDAGIEARTTELLSRMTLQEKVGQLNQYSANFDITGPVTDGDRERRQLLASGAVGSMLNVNGAAQTRAMQAAVVENSRLAIPLIFGFDVIHGYKTMFPIPLGETASWDLQAIESSARVAATEAAAAGVHWTFAPMIDIARDARWGRIMEGAGEDPYLASVVAAARVRGFQGTDLSAIDTVAACAKHFAGYGLAQAGRDYNVVDISSDTLHNVVLPPFRAALDAGVATVMNGFNEIGGTPVTASEELQRSILKGNWEFDGFVVSDWGSVGELVEHGVAEDDRHAALLALRAGSDMDMESDAYRRYLEPLVDAKELDLGLIDDAVRRVLRIKFQLGLFEDPYRYSDVERELRVTLTPAHLELARDVARKSIVLLQNRGDLLPLSKSSGSIAVIGPLAADKDTPLGSWRGKAITDSAVSLLEGIQAAVGDDVSIDYAQGAALGLGERSFVAPLQINEDDRSGFAAAIDAARGADSVVIALGEDAYQTGEGRSQVDLGLKGVQQDLLKAVLEVNPNVVLVLMNGRPLALSWESEHVPVLLETWHLGSQAGLAIADVLFGDFNPSGKLPVSFPRNVGQEPLYYNTKNTGRPGPSEMVFWSHYSDSPNTPVFAFGHGLSYTTFEYSRPRASSASMRRGGSGLEISVEVSNTGSRAGAEVVQLYVRDLVGSSTRPVLELKGFERIELAPGEAREVSFTLDEADLAFYTKRGQWQAEPGDFEVSVGPSSDDLQSLRFTLH